jgi:hypothetical protein
MNNTDPNKDYNVKLAAEYMRKTMCSSCTLDKKECDIVRKVKCAILFCDALKAVAKAIPIIVQLYQNLKKGTDNE